MVPVWTPALDGRSIPLGQVSLGLCSVSPAVIFIVAYLGPFWFRMLLFRLFHSQLGLLYS